MTSRAEHGEALAALYRTSYAELVRLAALLLGDSVAAEDVAQEAFVRLASRNGDQDGYGVGYLHRTVVNLTRSSWRRRLVARRALPKQAASMQILDDPQRECFDRLVIVQALQCLPRRQKEVIVLRYYQDLTEADTAKLLGISVGSVKSSAAHGLQNLRQRLETTDDARTTS